jgi:hypothetical protein
MKLRANVGCILNSYFKRKALLFSLVFIFGVIGLQLATIEAPAAAFPNPPSNLTVTAISSSSLSLQWRDNSTDEASFQIERCQGATCTNFALLRQVAANTITFTDTGLLANTTYRYRIAALGRNSKLSAYSNIAGAATFSLATAPVAPGNLVASAVSSSQINLAWTDNSNNETGFIVERALLSTGPWTQVATTSANIASWANAGLTPTTTYYYRVKAYNSVGNSAYSNLASATTQSSLAGAPAAPTANAATNVTSSGFTANWSSASGATGYRLDVSTSSSFGSYLSGYQNLDVGNVLSRSVSGLSASTNYYYRVRAYNLSGTSGNSTTRSVTTSAATDTTPPTVPTGLIATAVSSSQINLSWSASTDSGGSGLAGYRDYRSGTLMGSTTTTTYSSTGLTANIQYCYTVAAYDNAGNVSGQSTQACAVTQATSSPAWSKAFGSTTNDVGQAVAFDSSGNMYATGYFQGTVNFGCGSLSSNGTTYPDAFLAKYSSTGTCLWSKRLGGIYDDAGTGVVVDPNNNVIVTGTVGGYVTGTTVDFGGGPIAIYRDPNIFVAKYAADGTYQWAKTFGSSIGGSNIKPYAVAVDASGNVAVTGSFQNTIDFGGGPIVANGFSTDAFAFKLNSAGTHVWSKGMGGTTNESGRGIAFDPSGNVIVTGFFTGAVNFGCSTLTSAGGDDIFLVKYSPTGACQWSKQFGDTYHQEAFAVAVDSSSNIILTGQFAGTLNFGGSNLVNTYYMSTDIFVAKLNSLGGHIWSKSFGALNSERGTGIAVDSTGNVVMTGWFLGTVDFGGGPLTGGSGLTTFVAKYSPLGAHQWSKRFGGTDSNESYGLAVDSNGNLGVTGYFRSTVDFGQGALTSAGGQDGFLLKLAP